MRLPCLLCTMLVLVSGTLATPGYFVRKTGDYQLSCLQDMTPPQDPQLVQDSRTISWIRDEETLHEVSNMIDVAPSDEGEYLCVVDDNVSRAKNISLTPVDRSPSSASLLTDPLSITLFEAGYKTMETANLRVDFTFNANGDRLSCDLFPESDCRGDHFSIFPRAEFNGSAVILNLTRTDYNFTGNITMTANLILDSTSPNFVEAIVVITIEGPPTTGPTSTGPTSTGPTSTEPTSTGPTSTGPTSTGPTSTGPPCKYLQLVIEITYDQKSDCKSSKLSDILQSLRNAVISTQDSCNSSLTNARSKAKHCHGNKRYLSVQLMSSGDQHSITSALTNASLASGMVTRVRVEELENHGPLWMKLTLALAALLIVVVALFSTIVLILVCLLKQRHRSVSPEGCVNGYCVETGDYRSIRHMVNSSPVGQVVGPPGLIPVGQ